MIRGPVPRDVAERLEEISELIVKEVFLEIGRQGDEDRWLGIRHIFGIHRWDDVLVDPICICVEDSRSISSFRLSRITS